MLPQSTFCGLPYNKKSPVPGRSCRAARCKHPHLSRQQPLSEPEKCMRDIEDSYIVSFIYLFIPVIRVLSPKGPQNLKILKL